MSKFSFDDEPPVFNKPARFLPDPRDSGCVFLEARSIQRAKCSICNKDLSMDIFYFEGKTRKFVRCTGCEKYLFELEKKQRY